VTLVAKLRTHWRGLCAAVCLIGILYVASLGPFFAFSRKGYTDWLPGGIVRAYAFPGEALSRVPGLGRLIEFYVDTWLEHFDVRDATM